jgi:hypothetical protein
VRSVVFVALLLVPGGCGFRSPATSGDASSGDAAPDVPPDVVAVAPDCSADPDLLLCFSFDASPLPVTLPNEGKAAVSASLTDVFWTAHGAGGAVALVATSEIFVPMSSDVTGVQAFELWFRFDADAADGGRSGLVDSNVAPPNISLFVNRTGPIHSLRCGLGADVAQWDVANLPIATWFHAACVCDAGTLTMYLDGHKIGDHPGGGCSSGGAFTADGFIIGANNNGGSANVNDRLLGDLDVIRLWSVPLSAQTVCEHAGRTDCS